LLNAELPAPLSHVAVNLKQASLKLTSAKGQQQQQQQRAPLLLFQVDLEAVRLEHESRPRYLIKAFQKIVQV
jgi:hypothetical protein